MKKKTLVAILCIFAVSLSGCGQEPTQTAMTDEEISASIENTVNQNIEGLKNELRTEIKNELLKEVNTSIDNKLKDINTMSAEDQEALKNSIMASLEKDITEKINASSNLEQPQQIVKNITQEYPTHEYVTNEYVTEENITNVTEENNQYITNEVEEKYPPIEDDTVIPVNIDFPYTYQVNEYMTMNIESLTVSAFNHHNEPYREIDYPYELHIAASGTFTLDYEGEFPPMPDYSITISLQPHGTEFELHPGLNYETGTFSYTSSLTSKLVPDEVNISEKN